jgi:hypothetical protein
MLHILRAAAKNGLLYGIHAVVLAYTNHPPILSEHDNALNTLSVTKAKIIEQRRLIDT